MKKFFSDKAKDAPGSKYFQKAKREAEAYARDAGRTNKLLDAATRKAEKKRGPLEQVWDYLTALIRMVRAVVKREYTVMPWKSLVMAIAAIIYFVSPVDLIFDLVPFLGFIDDAAVITFVVKYIKNDLDDFLEWESRSRETAAKPAERSSMNKIKIERKPDAKRLEAAGVFQWSIWEKEVSEFPWHYDDEETCYFLEGEVVVTPEDGAPVEIGKADLVTFPKGMSCTWKVRKPVRKHYKFG